MKIKNCFYMVSVLLSLVVFTALCAAQQNLGSKGTVKGKLLFIDSSMQQEAVVLFFNAATGVPPAPEKYWRLPDEAGPVDDQGRYWINLPPGEYWMGAIKMPERIKNTQPGFDEWIYISRDSKDELQTIKVKEGQTTEIEDIMTIGSLNPLAAVEESATISGTIMNQNKQPLDGLAIEAYIQKNDKENPIFSSDLSTTQGQYQIKLPKGTFYLKIREPWKMNRNSEQYRQQIKYKLPGPTEVVLVAGQEIKTQNFIVQTP